ncbi:hypothetical protein [Streptomyces thermoalcalitolerans]|uniref:hypothetical protein n=1 Tax=Streptomyces thermoalcalitolerans TaxID=65605 RepID=UPI0031DEE4D5
MLSEQAAGSARSAKPAGSVGPDGAREAGEALSDEPARAHTDPFGSTDPVDSTGSAGSADSDGSTGSDPLRVRVDDPWRTEGTDGAQESHDPNEVTVQLDTMKPPGSAASAGFAAGKAADKPVFVDDSGRRSRRLRRFGMAVGLVCAAYAGVIVVTLLSGNAGAPWVPIPIPGVGDPPASKVKESPRPSETTGPSAGSGGLPGNGAPGTGADAGTGTDAGAGAGAPSAGATPSPGSTAAPGTSPRPGTTPGASAQPQPSASSTKKGTPDRTTKPTAPKGNDSPPAVTPQPADPSANPSPNPDPSDGPGGDSGGNGGSGGGDTTNNAGAAPTPTALASDGPTPASSAPSSDATPTQSPENVL